MRGVYNPNPMVTVLGTHVEHVMASFFYLLCILTHDGECW